MPKVIKHPFAFMPDGIHLFGLILIRRSRSNDGLIAHETVHYHQWKKEPFMFYLKYIFCVKCKLDYEVEAYKTSVEYGMPIEIAASYLSSGLYLWMTDFNTALELLKNEAR